MTSSFSYLQVPPLVDPPAVDAFFSDPLAGWEEGSEIVLVTPFWPGRVLGARWLSHLERVVAAVAGSSGQRPILAEVPVALASQLRDNHALSWLQDVDCVIDQLFMGAARLSASQRRRLCRELETRGEGWTSARLHDLKVIGEGHFSLPSGRHTDINVRFADLEWVTGGHGVRDYVTSRCARRLAPHGPDVILCWAERSQTTMHHLAEDVQRKLDALRCPVTLIQVRGTYAKLDRGIGNVEGRVAVLTDSMASGRLARELADLANQRGGSADIIGTFVRLSCAPDQNSFRATPGADLIALSAVDARHWDARKCLLCEQGVPLTFVNTDSRSAPQSFAPHAYQRPRAMYWSSVLLGGQAGLETREDDSHHLHGTYVQPGLDVRLLAPLVEKIAQELSALRVKGIIYHDTPTCRAVADALGTIIEDPELRFYAATRNDGAWDIATSAPAVADEVLAFLDDGANSGQSAQDALVQLSMSGRRVAAAVIVEDKLPEIRHKALEMLCKAGGAFEEEVRLFFVHRAPEAPVSSPEARCRACELAWLHALLGGAGKAPAFARSAHEDLRSERIWLGSTGHALHQGRTLMSVEQNTSPAEQMNALLAHHSADGLEANVPLLDTIVRDFMPELRASKFYAELDLLEPQWLERVFTWADAKDLGNYDLPDDNPSLELSLAVQDLRHAADAPTFAKRMGEVLEQIDRSPSLGEERYRDVLEHACIALLAADTPEAWLRGAVRAGRPRKSAAARALVADLRLLSERVVSAPRTGVVNAFYASTNRLIEHPSDAVVSRMLQTPAVIELRTPEPYVRLNGEITGLDLTTAATWALAVIDGWLFTSEASDFYQHVFDREFRTEGRSVDLARARRKTFERVWRTLIKAPGMPLSAHNRKRGEQKQRALSRTRAPCAVFWINDGRALGRTLTEHARKRRRSISGSS